MFKQNLNKSKTSKKRTPKKSGDKLTIIILSSILSFVDDMTDSNLSSARMVDGILLLDFIILLGLMIVLHFSKSLLPV